MLINCEVKNCGVKMRVGLREIQEGRGARTRTGGRRRRGGEGASKPVFRIWESEAIMLFAKTKV
ncbi:MAG: hypothetical protein MW690_001533 [Methanophagales archaeon]|nr:hypothetical protein [Methanophagales archaeon]